MVLSHAGKRLSAPAGLAEMIEAPEEVRDDLPCYQGFVITPGLRYFLVELQSADLDALAANAALHSALLALQGAPLKRLLRAVGRISRQQGMLVNQILLYIITQYDTSVEEISALLREQEQPELEAKMPTLAEKLIAEGQEKGLEKGRMEGQAETLIRLLHKRFGSIPGDDLNRIRKAAPSQLNRWTDALLDATDLPDIFTPTRTH